MIRKHREFESRERKEKRKRLKMLDDMPGFLEKRMAKLGIIIFKFCLDLDLVPTLLLLLPLCGSASDELCLLLLC